MVISKNEEKIWNRSEKSDFFRQYHGIRILMTYKCPDLGCYQGVFLFDDASDIKI